MNFIHAVILGVIEGFTEFLPVSSTGHLIIAGHLLKIPDTDFTKSFDITIQLGAIFAVLALYAKKILRNFELDKRIIAAFIPTGIIGFALYKIIKRFLLGSDSVALWAMFLGGVFLILFELWYKNKKSIPGDAGLADISYAKAAWIGLCQSLAVIPGISRSAATIMGGLAAGISREAIVEFSFLLALPTMAAAAGLDLLKSAGNFSYGDISILAAGFATSFIVAVASIKIFLRFIRRHTFIGFGVYRIVAAFIFWQLLH